jgi:hypothetical protein
MRWLVAVGRFGLSGSPSEAAKIWKPDSPIQTLRKPDSPAVAGLSGFLGENTIRHRIPGIYSAGRCRGEESTRIRICLVPWPKSVTQMADKSPSQDTTNMLPGLFINFLFVCRVHTHPHLSFLLSLVRLHSVEFLSHWDERHNPPALAAVIVPPIGNMPLFYEDGRGRGPEDCIFHRSEIGIRRSEVAYRFWICSPMAKSKLDY